jgi:Gpi18-like mannosyltransferase
MQKLSELPIKWHHLLFYSLLVAIIPHSGFWFDLNNDWPRWSNYAFEHGLSQIYHSDTNYMPFYLHGLYWFGKLQGSKELIYANSYQLKYFFLVFDFGGAIAIAWALRKYYTRQFAEYMLLFNIGYLYCTIIWGQLDSVPTTIVVLAIICLFERKLLWAAFFCTLSVYVKLQTIIFIPFFIILLVYQLSRNFNKWLIIKMLAISLLTQIWLLSPFIWGGTFWNFLKVVRESVGFFPRVSWNAYNIWYLLLKQDPTLLNDSLTLAGLSYKKWGFIMFFALSAFTFIPLIISTLTKLKHKKDLDKNYYALLWLTAGTIAILFFFVNTQMHERYSYPAIALYFAYALLSNRYGIFALASVAHLMNVDGMNKYFGLNPFKPEFTALIFGTILLLSFARTYQYLKLNSQQIQNK